MFITCVNYPSDICQRPFVVIQLANKSVMFDNTLEFFTESIDAFIRIFDFFIWREAYCRAILFIVYRIKELYRHVFPIDSLLSSLLWIEDKK